MGPLLAASIWTHQSITVLMFCSSLLNYSLKWCIANLHPLTTIQIIIFTLKMLLYLPDGYTTEVHSEN